MESYSIDSIVCPRCQAALDVAATSCDQCGASTVPGVATKKRLLDRPWLIIILMLHVGVLGIPLYWKTSYSLTARLMMIVASVFYTVFAVAGIAWGIAQVISAVRVLS